MHLFYFEEYSKCQESAINRAGNERLTRLKGKEDEGAEMPTRQGRCSSKPGADERNSPISPVFRAMRAFLASLTQPFVTDQFNFYTFKQNI